jgi:hypothetical protein
MYESPAVIATFDAEELLGVAYGGNPMCGNEGNSMSVGNGSCESPV